jgi:hypothetical protein
LEKKQLTHGVQLLAGKKERKKEKEKEKERGVRGLVVGLIRWAVLPGRPSSFQFSLFLFCLFSLFSVCSFVCLETFLFGFG